MATEQNWRLMQLASTIQNGSFGSSDGGNNSPSSKPKRQRLGKKFTVTWNNYPKGYQDFIMDHLDQHIVRCQFQTEVGAQGTPHIQGYVEFKQRYRPTEKFSKGLAKKLCFLSARGTAMANAVYTNKEGDDGWDGIWRYSKGMPRPLAKITYKMLRKDQQEIVDLFVEYDDPRWGRKVHWFWEEEGGWGKTTIVKYLVQNQNAVMCAGKAADCKFIVKNYIDQHQGEAPKIVIWCLPRTTEAYKISYTAMEGIKDGIFASSKYEGGMCVYNCPWVIVFANCPPCKESLTNTGTYDRWVIRELEK